ncbi:hypothetical protein NMY22_g7333 [Coprinellus aureogranulatus]|nr:hypothetical protein NMY22_g7333 [Coprinellus aureogranulatus]
MTISSSPLVVAAHVHNRSITSTPGRSGLVTSRTPNSARRPHSTPSRRNGRTSNWTSNSPIGFGSLPVESTTSSKERTVPLAALGDSSLGVIHEEDPIIGTSGSQAPRAGPSIAEGIVSAGRSGIELVGDKVKRISSRTNKLEHRIDELESLIRALRQNASGIVRDFEALRGDLVEFGECCEALESDHFTALVELQEEKFRVGDYIGKLRNSELEIYHLYAALPEGTDIGFSSQAKTFMPLYERYA